MIEDLNSMLVRDCIDWLSKTLCLYVRVVDISNIVIQLYVLGEIVTWRCKICLIFGVTETLSNGGDS